MHSAACGAIARLDQRLWPLGLHSEAIMTRAVIKGSGNDGKQLGKIAALAEVKPDSTSRIKTLYRIMQSVEVGQSSLSCTILNA